MHQGGEGIVVLAAFAGIVAGSVFGPRLIRLAGSVDKFGVGSTCLLTGCPLATSCAKAFLYQMIKGVIDKHPVAVRQHNNGMKLRATEACGS